jgi:hypothetical protein
VFRLEGRAITFAMLSTFALAAGALVRRDFGLFVVATLVVLTLLLVWPRD